MSGNEVVVDGVHVTLSDDNDEDLLEYEPAAKIQHDEQEEGQVHPGINSDAEVREAAKALLRKMPSKVHIHYEGDVFILFDYDDDDDTEDDNDSFNSCPIICKDIDITHESCTNLMASIREFLGTYYNKIQFGNKEILINIPTLDITICEDNLYNNQVTFDDIQAIFNILQKRSKEQGEINTPKYLDGIITTRPRFVSRYNALVELTEGNATLQNIKPFSNDEKNPVVLDDDDDDNTNISSAGDTPAESLDIDPDEIPED